jgi:hypothetical protein
MKRLTIQTIVQLPANFCVGDTVRFVGTETPFTVKQYDKATHEYQVQRDNDDASIQWVLDIYLERPN